MPRINRNNAVGLALGHGMPPSAAYSTQAQGVNSNYLDHSTAKRGETHMRKLPFQVRGAVYETAAALALRAGLTDEAADGLLGVMLDYIGGDQVRVHGVLGPAAAPEAVAPAAAPRTTLPPIDMPPERLSAPLLAAGYWVAKDNPIASLGPQHGPVLVCGDKVPCTWAIAYRDTADVLRNKDTGERLDWATGERLDWATRWWPLP